MVFKDRSDAAIQLADALVQFKDTDAVIIAIPRGAVPMGKIISDILGLPLDIILVKKLSHPIHREYAIGSVSLSSTILADTLEVSEKYIQEEIAKIRKSLLDKYQKYYANRNPISLKDKIVIIVDDGIATGLTLLSTIELIHQQGPAKILIATPVASISGKHSLASSPYVDDIICLHAPEDFRMVGAYYKNFDQVSDEEVMTILKS